MYSILFRPLFHINFMKRVYFNVYHHLRTECEPNQWMKYIVLLMSTSLALHIHLFSTSFFCCLHVLHFPHTFLRCVPMVQVELLLFSCISWYAEKVPNALRVIVPILLLLLLFDPIMRCCPYEFGDRTWNVLHSLMWCIELEALYVFTVSIHSELFISNLIWPLSLTLIKNRPLQIVVKCSFNWRESKFQNTFVCMRNACTFHKWFSANKQIACLGNIAHNVKNVQKCQTCTSTESVNILENRSILAVDMIVNIVNSHRFCLMRYCPVACLCPFSRLSSCTEPKIVKTTIRNRYEFIVVRSFSLLIRKIIFLLRGIGLRINPN